MNINRGLLIYIALISSGTLFFSIRASFQPSMERKIEGNITSIKEAVDRVEIEVAAKSKISTEIDQIKQDIARSRTDEVISETVSSPSAVLGQSQTQKYIKISESFGALESMDVYDVRSFSGKIVGQIVPNKSYTYSAKQDNWFLVQIEGGKEGWVNSKLVTEANAP